MKEISDLKLALFQIGTFLSNLGTSTFVVATLSSGNANGISLTLAGLAIVSNRSGRIVSNVFFGHFVDIFPVGKLIVFSELLAGLFALGAMSELESARQGQPTLFLSALFLRTFFGAFLSNGSAKIGKSIDITRKLQGGYARVLNLIRSGPIVVASILVYLIFARLPLSYTIAFDFFTFTLNSVIIASLFWNFGDTDVKPKTVAGPIFDTRIIAPRLNLFSYPALLPGLFKSELILSILVFGDDALVARQLVNSQSFIPLCLGLMGLGVWLGYFWDKNTNVNARIVWGLLLGATFLRILTEADPVLFSIIVLVHSTCYSVLYNRLSAHVLNQSPQEIVGKINSSRITIEFFLSILGVLWVTSTTWIWNGFELLWRIVLALPQIVNKISNFKKSRACSV